MDRKPLTVIRVAVVHLFGFRTREEIEAEHERDSERTESVRLGIVSATQKVHEANRHLSRPATVPEIAQ
jgi:hypothetical protein